MYSAKTNATRCSYGDESAYTSPQSYTLPSTEPDEPAWIADPTLTYEDPDDFPVNEETEEDENTSTEDDSYEEPEIDEFDLIGDLFSDPISVVVPVSDENPTETPEISILPENPTLEQLKEATKKVPPTCAGITATYVCGTHDATPTYSGESISITAGDELAMNSLVLTIVEIDASGNGMGTIKLPMLNGARVGLKLNGIQAVKGGCIVAGRAELGGVPMLNLDAKLKENLESLAMGLQVIGLAGQEYATEIANGINKTIDSIEQLGKKLTEKKRNTQALLTANDLTKLDAAVSNCNEIATDSKAMMDSLTSLICKVKAGTLKANLKKLEKSLNDNKAFMDKLGPALAECPNSGFTPWQQKECKGPCAFEWENYAIDENCKKKLDAVFGVSEALFVYLFDTPELLPENIIDNSERYSDNKTEFRKNLCGEYIGYYQTDIISTGRGAVTSRYYVAPKGKKAISQNFGNEIEYFQYLVLRVLYSDQIGCKNFATGTDTYLDADFFKKREIVLEFLAMKYSSFDLPIWKGTGVNNQASLDLFKEKVLTDFFDPSKNQAVQLEWIKIAHSKIVYKTYGELAAAITPIGINLAPEISSGILSLRNGFSSIVRKFALNCPGLLKGVQGAGNYLFKVDNALKSADEIAGVLVNGSYLKNPTAKSVVDLVKNPSGTMKLDQSAGSILNGQYMYVVDKADNIIIGTRATGISPFNGKAPHPTLVGGIDPTVKTAGIIEFRAGKIYKVDNVSGHFKPSAQSLQNAQPLFNQKFAPNNFADDFQGFVPFSN